MVKHNNKMPTNEILPINKALLNPDKLIKIISLGSNGFIINKSIEFILKALNHLVKLSLIKTHFTLFFKIFDH